MTKQIFIMILITAFFTGCNNSEPKPVDVLSEEVQELNIKDKRHIYKLIENEIMIYNKKGDKAYSAMEYHNALQFYKMVNFYKGYSCISDKKLNSIKKDIYKKSLYHYRRALKSKNAKRELKELNLVMMYNPDYKNVKQLYETSLAKRRNKIFVNALENDLYAKLLNPKITLKDIKEINIKSKILHKYKYSSKILTQAQNLVEVKYKVFFEKAVKLYHDRKLKDAKKSFVTLSSIYKNDVKSKRYLQKIQQKEYKRVMLSKASKAFFNKEYKNAILYANNVLASYTNNKQAKKILLNATKLSNEKVERLLAEGKYNYTQKKLEKAKDIFAQVLDVDAKNTTALLYKSKIQRQLETITSLQ